MSRPRRLLAILALLAIGALTVASLFVSRLDLESVKQGLERSLSASVGAQVRLQGPVEPHFLPPGASIPDVVVHVGDRELLTVKRVRAGIALLPLLWREVRLSSLTFYAPALHLWRNPDGTWPFTVRDTTSAFNIGRVTVRGGAVRYADAARGTDVTLDGVEVAIDDLRRDDMGRVSFSGDFRVHRIGFGRVELHDLKGKLDGDKNLYRIYPLRFGLFGNEAGGNLELDWRATPPTWRAEVVARKLSLAALSQSLAGKPLYEGVVGLHANLAGEVSARIAGTVDGTLRISGTGLTQHGINVDRLIAEFRESRDINPVDIAVVTFAGPMGALVTKGVEVARMIRTTQREDRQVIAELAFDWSLQDGVARTDDVAIRTEKNRLAFKGAVDLANERYDGMTVALLNKEGCAELTEKITGPLIKPAVEKVSMLGTLAETLAGAIRQGWAIIDFTDCRPFYEGRVTHQ